MKKKVTLVLGADHAGYQVKEYIKTILSEMGYQFEDLGTFSEESVDYPDYAERVSLEVKNGKDKMGILACGTGIGASIAANKIPGIRAALVIDQKTARLSREHNDANILVLGGRPFDRENVKKIVKAWLESEFQGGRHKNRLEKILKLEEKYCKNERFYEDTPMNETVKSFLNQVVVVDTDSRWLYVGTLKQIGTGFLVLEDVDAHDLSETTSTRDEYLGEMKQNGLMVNRRKVVVSIEKVTGISLLEDVEVGKW